MTPPVADVLALVSALTSPTEAALRTYASHLSTADRTGLWIGLEQAAVPVSLLSAVAQASGGLGAAAVHHIRARVEAERQQAGRAELIKRLQNGSVTGANQAAACDLALYLLGLQTVGDAGTAASLVISAGGAARGSTSNLRALFQDADDRNNKTFTARQREALANLNLLPKPKRKSMLGKLLDL